MKTGNQLQLTGVFVQDPEGKGYTAFFAQFPNIIAEGDTPEAATQNLIVAVSTVFEYQKNVELKNTDECGGKVFTKTFDANLAFA